MLCVMTAGITTHEKFNTRFNNNESWFKHVRYDVMIIMIIIMMKFLIQFFTENFVITKFTSFQWKSTSKVLVIFSFVDRYIDYALPEQYYIFDCEQNLSLAKSMRDLRICKAPTPSQKPIFAPTNDIRVLKLVLTRTWVVTWTR